MLTYVTASDSLFFEGTRILQRAVRASGNHLRVFNLGLSASQIHKLSSFGADIIRPIVSDQIRLVRDWKLWIKPLLLEHLPLGEPFVWIDSDAVLLRPKLVEETLKDEHLIISASTPGYRETCRNLDGLYEHLPIKFTPSEKTLNAGFLAFDMTKIVPVEIFNRWCWATKEALEKPLIRRFVRWHDQGLLLWALNSLGIADLIRSDDIFNTLPQKTEDYFKRKPYSGTTSEVISNLMIDHPNSAVVHYVSRPKLWEIKAK